MKYKIGDTVRIREDAQNRYGRGPGLAEPMLIHLGRIYEIQDADPLDDSYRLKDCKDTDGYVWWWQECMLDPVIENNIDTENIEESIVSILFAKKE